MPCLERLEGLREEELLPYNLMNIMDVINNTEDTHHNLAISRSDVVLQVGFRNVCANIKRTRYS